MSYVLKGELTYVIVMILIPNVVVLVDERLHDGVLLHTKLEVEPQVRVTKNDFEITQASLKKAERSTMRKLSVCVRTYKLMQDPVVTTRSSATRVPVHTNSPSLVTIAAIQQ